MRMHNRTVMLGAALAAVAVLAVPVVPARAAGSTPLTALQTKEQAGTGKSSSAGKDKDGRSGEQSAGQGAGRASSKDGGWQDKPMTALEASEEADASAQDLSRQASVSPKYVRIVRTYDGTGENLVREDIYDLKGRVYQSISYGNLTAQLSCYDYDADGIPSAGSYLAMDFAGNDAYGYAWQTDVEKPGNGTIVYAAVSDTLGPVYTWWYHTDGTLAKTEDFDPAGLSGTLTIQEYTYSTAGILERAVTNEIDKQDSSRYISTEYLYDDYGNAVVCNVKNTVKGTREQYDLTHYVRRAKNNSWQEAITAASSGSGSSKTTTETTEHYDFDEEGDVTRRIHFVGDDATRVSRYDYLPKAEYQAVWRMGGYDTTVLNARQGTNLILERIGQFSVPEKSRPTPAQLIRQNGGKAVFGSNADHAQQSFSEAYEKNGVFFYVESLPASFFRKNYPGTLQGQEADTVGRAVYYGNADTMRLFGAELWLDAADGSEKIDTWVPEN